MTYHNFCFIFCLHRPSVVQCGRRLYKDASTWMWDQCGSSQSLITTNGLDQAQQGLYEFWWDLPPTHIRHSTLWSNFTSPNQLKGQVKVNPLTTEHFLKGLSRTHKTHPLWWALIRHLTSTAAFFTNGWWAMFNVHHLCSALVYLKYK